MLVSFSVCVEHEIRSCVGRAGGEKVSTDPGRCILASQPLFCMRPLCSPCLGALCAILSVRWRTEHRDTENAELGMQGFDRQGHWSGSTNVVWNGATDMVTEVT